MMKLTKLTAILCALSMMAIAAGCSKKDEESKEPAETVATVDLDNLEEILGEDEESQEETTEAPTEEESSDDASSDNGELDSESTYGSMTYSYSSDWVASETSSQISYQLPDNTGAIILQLTDGSAVAGVSEDEMVEYLAEESETAWENLDGMVVAERTWDDEMIPGKKCYVVSYSYDIASINTQNVTVFFANFTDDVQDVFAITCTALTEDSSVTEYMGQLLASITFSETAADDDAADEEVTTEADNTTNAASGETYSEGMYKVGTDIPAGEYCLFSDDEYGGYYSVCKNSNVDDIDSIINNDNFDYNAFVTVSDGQYLELSRAYAVPVGDIDGKKYKIETDGEGTFRVGTDIEAGEYKLECTEAEYSGYYCVYDSSDPEADIVGNDSFDGQAYVTVTDGQYLQLSFCKIAE